MKGFTLVELLMITAILGILIGIATISLTSVQQRTSLNAVVDTFIADMKGQQMKAMAGDTEGSGAQDYYGIHLKQDSYILFRGATYSATSTSNFTVNLQSSISLTHFFPTNQILFLKGSGAIASFPGLPTITFKDTTINVEKTITLNKYGVVSGIN